MPRKYTLYIHNQGFRNIFGIADLLQHISHGKRVTIHTCLIHAVRVYYTYCPAACIAGSPISRHKAGLRSGGGGAR